VASGFSRTSRLQATLQILAELLESFPAVADRRLAIERFGQRATERWVIEDRVVAEATGSAWLGRNKSLGRPAGLEHDAIALGDGQCTHKSRRASGLWNPTKLFLNQGELLRVGRVAPEPRRVNAGRATQRVDFQAGILGDCERGRVLGIESRLLDRVLRKGGPGFVGRSDRRVIGERLNVDRQASEQRNNLAELASIRGGDQ
jgi:hypothetical protein